MPVLIWQIFAVGGIAVLAVGLYAALRRENEWPLWAVFGWFAMATLFAISVAQSIGAGEGHSLGERLRDNVVQGVVMVLPIAIAIYAGALVSGRHDSPAHGLGVGLVVWLVLGWLFKGAFSLLSGLAEAPSHIIESAPGSLQEVLAPTESPPQPEVVSIEEPPAEMDAAPLPEADTTPETEPPPD
jgi:hypothetical protein